MTMAGDSGKVMFQSSRVVSPVPAQSSVMSVMSVNRGRAVSPDHASGFLPNRTARLLNWSFLAALPENGLEKWLNDAILTDCFNSACIFKISAASNMVRIRL